MKTKKTFYHLTYEFLGGIRELKTHSLFVWGQRFEEATNNPHVNQASIRFQTTEEEVDE